MAAPQSPIGSRRRLGAELRRLRLKTGLTLDDVAAMMTCSTSKISRLETGKAVPKVPDVGELMRIYGVASDTERDMLLRLVKDGRQHGWWEPLTDGVAPQRFVMDVPSRYTALETTASAVRSFELTILHGLLQIPEYTRAVIRTVLPGRPDDEIERLVRLRQGRQEALVRRDPPLELSVILDEAVLRRVVSSPALMVDQLEALREAARMPNVEVRVLTFDQGFHRSHVGSFVVLEFPPDVGSDVVYMEGHAGDTYLENPADVTLYKDVLSDVSLRANDPRGSMEIVDRYLAAYRNGDWKAPPGE